MAQFGRIRIIGINLGWIYTNLDGFILIYPRFNMFIFVFDVFMNLVCPISVPQALVFRNFRGKRLSLIFGLCQFWKLFELSEFQYIRTLGPVEKDARRKITNSGGTKTSRSLMVSQSVNKTMNWLLNKVRRSAPGQPTLVTLTSLQKHKNLFPNQPLVTLFAWP